MLGVRRRGEEEKEFLQSWRSEQECVGVALQTDAIATI